MQLSFKKSYALYFLVLIFAFFYFFSLSFQGTVSQFIILLADYLGRHKFAGIFIFLLLSAFSALLSPLSSLPLIPSAMVAWGQGWTLFFLLFGWMIGGVLGWVIGNVAGQKVIRKYSSFEKIEYYKNKLSTKKQFWIVLVFRLAVPSEITGFTLGILKYNFRKYLIATFISELPFAFLAVYSGIALVDGDIFIFIILVFFTLIIISAMSLYLKNQI